MRIEWVKSVLSDGNHNAFTSLAFWRGSYWLAFRSGQGHGGVGKIVLLESTNLETWSRSIPANTPLDDRDPKLLATTDRLFLYWVAMSPSEDEEIGQTLVIETQDGSAWSNPQPAYLPGYSFWEPREHSGSLYVAADFDAGPPEAAPERRGQVELLRSEDGLTWRQIATITQGNMCTETALAFLPDGRLLAITRQNAPPHRPRFSLATPPYTQWQYVTGTFAFQGPAATLIDDTILVSGRVRAGEIEAAPDPHLRPMRTGLLTFDVDQMRLIWHCNLPTTLGEDLSYPGIVPLDERRALVSFYDGRELSASDIFLACIEV